MAAVSSPLAAAHNAGRDSSTQNAGPVTCSAADTAPKPPIAAARPEHPPLSPEWLAAFLEEFKVVVNPSKVLPTVISDVEHRIQTLGRPLPANFGGWIQISSPLQKLFYSWSGTEMYSSPTVCGPPR